MTGGLALLTKMQCIYKYICIGSCVSRGFTGCCESGDCTGGGFQQPFCYCDEICHHLDDCCDDIDEISCPDPGKITENLYVQIIVILRINQLEETVFHLPESAALKHKHACIYSYIARSVTDISGNFSTLVQAFSNWGVDTITYHL